MQPVMLIHQKLLKHQCTEILQILFSVLCIKYFFFWSYRSIGLKGNIEYTKKGITSAVECADVAAFTFAT